MWCCCPLLVSDVAGCHLVALGLREENGLNYLVGTSKAWKTSLFLLVGQNLLTVRLGMDLRHSQSWSLLTVENILVCLFVCLEKRFVQQAEEEGRQGKAHWRDMPDCQAFWKEQPSSANPRRTGPPKFRKKWVSSAH